MLGTTAAARAGTLAAARATERAGVSHRAVVAFGEATWARIGALASSSLLVGPSSLIGSCSRDAGRYPLRDRHDRAAAMRWPFSRAR